MKATLYIWPSCPFCQRSIELLKEKNAELEIHDVSNDPELRQKISESVGGWSTVPMIFVDGKFIGGCDDLEKSGLLGS